ncbi:GGDEF domain-containing protein [Rhizobium sp. YIM 134829]|uniref:GGDEF domain-containing protein n=1 Tax=Rhizobium sp. YIM 134829 TaxID=3390453 RepID=UPI00397E0699
MNWSSELVDAAESSRALIGLYDHDNRLQYANAAFRQAYFVAPGEKILWTDLMRRNYQNGRGTRIETAEIEAWLAGVLSRRGKDQHRSYESDLMDGRWIYITLSYLPNGWSLFVGVDVTQMNVDHRALRISQEHAQLSANTDELTGISNRRHIMELLTNFLNGAHFSGKTDGSVCLFDLDHFKRINDVYGHPAGDQVLVHFARTVRANIRVEDCFGRLGGEEFLLFFPGLAFCHTELIVNRILAEVRRSLPIADTPALRYTCSVGMTDVRAGDTPRIIYARADEALYSAKSAGRDRVTFAA